MLLRWKWMGLSLNNNNLLRCCNFFSSELVWDSYIVCTAKRAPKGNWSFEWSFFLLRLHFISLKLPSLIAFISLAAAVNCCLNMVDKLQKQIWLSILHLILPLNPWLIFEIELRLDIHWSWLNLFLFLVLLEGLLVILISCTVSIPWCYKISLSTVSFLLQLDLGLLCLSNIFL